MWKSPQRESGLKAGAAEVDETMRGAGPRSAGLRRFKSLKVRASLMKGLRPPYTSPQSPSICHKLRQGRAGKGPAPVPADWTDPGSEAEQTYV